MDRAHSPFRGAVGRRTGHELDRWSLTPHFAQLVCARTWTRATLCKYPELAQAGHNLRQQQNTCLHYSRPVHIHFVPLCFPCIIFPHCGNCFIECRPWNVPCCTQENIFRRFPTCDCARGVAPCTGVAGMQNLVDVKPQQDLCQLCCIIPRRAIVLQAQSKLYSLNHIQ